MSLDLVGAFVLSAISAIAIGLPALWYARAPGGVALLAAHILWFVAVVALAGSGALAWGLELGAPLLGLSIVTPIVVLVVLATVVPATSRALASIPLPALISVHAIRIVGFLFLLLLATGRISAPFAPSAGWGDRRRHGRAGRLGAVDPRRRRSLAGPSLEQLWIARSSRRPHPRSDVGAGLAAAAVFRSAGLDGLGHAAMGAHPGIPGAAADRQSFGDLSAAGPVSGSSRQHRFDIEDPRFGVI
jgi:hypothetical protein